jgi:endonuclease YncB( thermonuclease family)
MKSSMKRTLGVLAAIGTAGTLFGPLTSIDAATTTTEVVKIADGDTFDAEVFGEVQRVRMLGINSTETGECHAEEAKIWLKERIEGRDVDLTAKDPSVTLNFGRPARFVDLDGDDIGAEMLELGLVTPYPHATETARNNKYLDLAAQAKSKGIGVWDDDACGIGPDQDSGVNLHVRWDAEEVDSQNVNGEWIDVYNPSDTPIDLTGWRVRDSSTRFYDFARGTTVQPGAYVRLHIGYGTDTAVHKYWNMDHPVFDNDLGESVYLFDPDGDIRDSFAYRCRLDCVNRYTDLTLDMNVDAEGDDNTNINGEWIDLINNGDKRIKLYGTYIETFPYALHFEPHHSIGAHSVLRIYVGRGTNSGQTLYLNKTAPILTNAGETVTLNRKDGLVLEKLVWPVPFVSCTVTPGPSLPPSDPIEGSVDGVGAGATATAGAERLGMVCD